MTSSFSLLCDHWSYLNNLRPDLSDPMKHDKHKNVNKLKYFCLDLLKLDGLTFKNISHNEYYSGKATGSILT